MLTMDDGREFQLLVTLLAKLCSLVLVLTRSLNNFSQLDLVLLRLRIMNNFVHNYHVPMLASII